MTPSSRSMEVASRIIQEFQMNVVPVTSLQKRIAIALDNHGDSKLEEAAKVAKFYALGLHEKFQNEIAQAILSLKESK